MARCAFSDTAAARFRARLSACLCGSADGPSQPTPFDPSIPASVSSGDAASEATPAPSTSSGDALSKGTPATFASSDDALSAPTTAPSTSSGDAAPEQQQTDVVPLLQQTDGVPSIFLSHSGKQKGFVERLNDHLVNAGHHPYLDEYTIPRGVSFPEHIKQAATQCKLGVVVLSDDFMTSKWPMTELDILTNSSAQVMPIFYKLSPEDVKSPMKLSEWRKEWEKMAKNRAIDISRWEKAVESLASQAGEVYRSGASEGEYIRKIVSEICKSFPPPISYDVSYVKGLQRLIKEVGKRFEHALLACKSVSNVPAIGMHGIGGLGKTTLCKFMTNVYQSSYSGKSVVMEFPSQKDNASIVNECKKVLTILTGADKIMLERVNSFDQVDDCTKYQSCESQLVCYWDYFSMLLYEGSDIYDGL